MKLGKGEKQRRGKADRYKRQKEIINNWILTVLFLFLFFYHLFISREERERSWTSSTISQEIQAGTKLPGVGNSGTQQLHCRHAANWICTKTGTDVKPFLSSLELGKVTSNHKPQLSLRESKKDCDGEGVGGDRWNKQERGQEGGQTDIRYETEEVLFPQKTTHQQNFIAWTSLHHLAKKQWPDVAPNTETWTPISTVISKSKHWFATSFLQPLPQLITP